MNLLPFWGLPHHNADTVARKKELPKAQLRPALLRATFITLLALAGGVLLVSMITVIVTSLKSYTVTPSDLLPAEQTLVLFSQADDALLRQYEPWLPILKSLPFADIPRTVAVIDLKGEGKAIAFFARRPLPSGIFPTGPLWSEKDLGPLTVVASTPSLFSLFASPAAPLRSLKAYQLLSRDGTEGEPWIYAKSSVLPVSTTAADTILASLITADATHLSIFPRGESGTVIHLFPGSSDDVLSPLPALPTNAQAIFSIALTNAAAHWKAIQSHLSSTQLLILEAKILTLITSTFGVDVSAEYDVQPLLQNPARLTLTRTASGASAFLLLGSADQATQKLSRIHDAFRGNLTSARIVSRIFDKGRYTFNNIRDDSSLLTDESYALEGAQVHATAHGTERGLFSATKGESFALSSDRALLEETVILGIDTDDRALLGDGMFSFQDLLPRFGSPLPQLLASPSPLLPRDGTSFRWSLTRQGDLKTLTILPVRSSR